MPDRFPPPWKVSRIAGGFKVTDANGFALAYVYSKPSQFAADQQMTEDQARRIARGIARLPELMQTGSKG